MNIQKNIKSDSIPFAIIEKDSNGYKFGFQGQEAENEIWGEGNASFYKYRISDNRLGRFFSIDPLAAKYPHNSPYAFSENRVIDAIELEGLEAWKGANKAEDVMSKADFKEFVVAELKLLNEQDIRLDCADLAVYLMAKYFYVKDVPLLYTNPFNGKIVNSSDTRWGNYQNGEIEGFYMFFFGYKDKIGQEYYKNREGAMAGHMAGLVSSATIIDLGITELVNGGEKNSSFGDFSTSMTHLRMNISGGGLNTYTFGLGTENPEKWFPTIEDDFSTWISFSQELRPLWKSNSPNSSTGIYSFSFMQKIPNVNILGATSLQSQGLKQIPTNLTVTNSLSIE